MISTKMFSSVTFLYLAGTVLYFNFLAFRSEQLGKVATALSWATLLIHTAAILWRWVESYQLGMGHAPLSNMYESLVFFSWCIALLYLLWERKMKSRIIGAFAMPFAFLFIAYASLAPGVSDRIDPLIPALQSNWLHAHVITCFLSYASFALSCGVSIMYLLKIRKKEKGKKETGWISLFPPLESLDALVYKTIAVGFPLLTIGIITGAAWANYAWGSYWSWDPKETWSLITWFVYAIFLHARFAREWRGKRTAVISVIGFAAVIFTYFGVNYVLSGLHSYA
ncbi:MAG: c-type cytochrome biogenesis protein CcsB [Deltaproteobacteria bacterium]|jgi:cytochrome c-type biogenesis protein CcsB|nr:c-type cytochrome biogenesis protein CcsB [Deltaproteobacteria bacterium]